MMARFTYNNNSLGLPQFVVSLSGTETIVECSNLSHFFDPCNETGDLHPHKNGICDCADVEHAKTFRLKFEINEYSLHLYISCEPSDEFDVKCQFLNPFSQHPFNYDVKKYLGWKYLGERHIKPVFPLRAFRVSLKLYKARTKCIEKKYNLKPTLTDNFSKLLIDETYSDVTVLSDDGVAIKAHRAILANRSEVFHAALKHNQTADTITSPFQEDTLRIILTYIYTDKIPNSGDFTGDLFMAADYYKLLALKNVCSVAFHNQLTVHNAIATLKLAERHCLKDLINFTLNFIKNHFPLIVETEDWDNIKSIELVKMICKFNAQIR